MVKVHEPRGRSGVIPEPTVKSGWKKISKNVLIHFFEITETEDICLQFFYFEKRCYMDNNFMYQAVKLAKKGFGLTNPNPPVGALIIKSGKIIGTGLHKFYGGPHAEVNAINSLTENASGADLFVTLEPCSHFGKTPPCTDLIIKTGIKRVFIGMKDPNPLVSGNGIKKLREAGIEVVTEIYDNNLKSEISEMYEIFSKYIVSKIPFCLIKYAMTLDGKISTVTGDSKWISNELSREYVHEFRQRFSAILIGIETVLKDNPSLTTRLKNESTYLSASNPFRIIVDSSARIPLNCKLISENHDKKTIVVITEKAANTKITELKKKGCEVLIAPSENGRVDLNYLFPLLGSKGIDSVMVEGGGELNYSVIESGFADKLFAFISPKILGGRQSTSPIGGKGISEVKSCWNLVNTSLSEMGNDFLIKGYLKKGE